MPELVPKDFEREGMKGSFYNFTFFSKPLV